MEAEPAVQLEATHPSTGLGAFPRLDLRRAASYWSDLVFGRTVPALFFGFFIILKVYSAYIALGAGPGHWLQVANDVLGSVYFILLTFLYTVRYPRRGGDRRLGVIAVAFFGSFAVMVAGDLPTVAPRGNLLLPCDLLQMIGVVYAVYSLFYLRRSFSILPEARKLVTGGPYALSRHPLYLGEGMAALGLTVPTIGPVGVLLLGLNLGCQYLRINWEEQVLEREFGTQYRQYAAGVPKYLPNPRRLLSRARAWRASATAYGTSRTA